MTRVLLIGNGAREHAIAAALDRCDVSIHAHMSMMNPGIAKIAERVTIADITKYRELPDLVGIDYAVLGPEAPLSTGIADFLEDRGIPCVGPRKELAKIETSKSYARRVIASAMPLANPRYVVARRMDDLSRFEKKVGAENIVVKPDGLTGGKGVKIFGDQLHSQEETKDYVAKLLSSKGKVLLEEKLQGTEFTVQAFVDGTRIKAMPLVRDYKRAFDSDKGPNTGSMGSYSKSDHGLSYVTESDLKTAKGIMLATIEGMREQTGVFYKGILYGQFMKSEEGIKVIEYNARFGDPEAMNVLSIMKSPIDDMFQGVIDGNLSTPVFEPYATVCVYVVPEGYPGPEVAKDMPFSIEPSTTSEIYYASVDERDSVTYTTGSRTVGVLAKAETVVQAREQAYADVKRINGKLRFRSDIAEVI